MAPPSQRQLRLLHGRSNPFQILLGLFTTAVLFIMFQVNVLKSLQHSQKTFRTKESIKLHKSAPDMEENINPKFIKKFMKEIGILVNRTELYVNKIEFKSLVQTEAGSLESVRALRSPAAGRYHHTPSDNGRFKCIDNNQLIPLKFINDNYCDCSDGSDETGTSACSNGRFFCKQEHDYLPSSKVNDGLCDCCDGSDEWDGVILASDLRLPDSKSVHRSPCSDRCTDYESTKVSKFSIIKDGANIKQPYLDEGAAHIGNGEFGPHAEFYKLSRECFKFKSTGYTYEICPYVNATQRGENIWLIGVGGKLEGSQENGFILVMDGGEWKSCPGRDMRRTIIIFHCAARNQISNVTEKETCIYSVHFESPAACHDLFPVTEDKNDEHIL